jgi:hypothetical protein
VQQALEVLELFTNNEFESDSAYKSDSSDPRQRRRKGCLQLVKEIIDRFIVRGTYSPMQWMLDLRTYGLKIYPRAVTTLSPLCRFCFRFVSDEIFVLLRSFRHVASILLRLEVSVVRFA